MTASLASTRFDLPSYVLQAFAGLRVNVDLISSVKIGDYSTVLSYVQEGVPAYTDQSLTVSLICSLLARSRRSCSFRRIRQLLLPILARPIVQKIVDEAALGIDTVMISDPSNTGSSRSSKPSPRAVLTVPFSVTSAFTAGLVGSLTNSGPFDAVISFPEGLTIAWNGQPLGQIAMPNVRFLPSFDATRD